MISIPLCVRAFGVIGIACANEANRLTRFGKSVSFRPHLYKPCPAFFVLSS